ncbi:MAG TPA: outer membrane protein transport protein [Oculatellaceae cyanobacterium]
MRWQIALCFLLWNSYTPEAQGQIANLISGVGAINQSMGGAATAMPLDASGSQFWNPATITELEATELDINAEPVFVMSTLSSSIPANAIAPDLPPINLSGEVKNRANFTVAPSIGFVKKIEQSPWRWGVLVTGVGGSTVNFTHHGNNPVTLDPPIGSGDTKVFGSFLQISPTIAYRLNKHWSLGVQPNFNITGFSSEPFSGAPPLDFDGDGIPTYPKIKKEAYAPGIGVQGGLYYHRSWLHLGASIKSPQWFLPYHPKVTYETGVERRVSTRANVPMIASVGVGFSGIPRTKIAVDARYIDYANTTSYDKVGFTPQATVKGSGWQSIWALASGIQYEMSENCSVRIGYSYNLSPIKPIYTAFAIGSPAVTQNYLSVGASYRFSPRFTLAAMFRHGFQGSRQGPIQTPLGPLPGSSIRLKTALNVFVISLIFKF